VLLLPAFGEEDIIFLRPLLLLRENASAAVVDALLALPSLLPLLTPLLALLLSPPPLLMLLAKK
jgi:hypothetical protein